MQPALTNKFFQNLQLLTLAAVVVFALFAWQGNKGLNLWDEGFLWYGAQRVMHGDVPNRDFMSYDPGRYYWSAGFMHLCGNDGIMTMRLAAAVFQTLGLFFALWLIAQSTDRRDWGFLLLSAITIAVWMFPRHKLFDSSLSIFLIWAIAFLVRSPIGRIYFLTGVCVGLAAVFGRNHATYGMAGSLLAMLWLQTKRQEGPGTIRAFQLWVSGVVVGMTPLLAMAVLIPGYAKAYWEVTMWLTETKSTNLPLPVPWPWRVASGTLGPVSISNILTSLFFLSLLIFGVLSLVTLAWKKLRAETVSPGLAAAAFLSLPYAHYAFSRADVGHLALGIMPFLIGCLVLFADKSAKLKWPLVSLLCASSLISVFPNHPGWQCLVSKQWVKTEISGNMLIVDPGTASDVELLRKLESKYAPNGQNILITPFWPGAYALLKRKSPMWEIYALWPRPQAFEQAEIKRIKAAQPQLAFVIDVPLDSREELRFRNTHPLIWQYISDNFVKIPESPNPDYLIFRSKRS